MRAGDALSRVLGGLGALAVLLAASLVTAAPPGLPESETQRAFFEFVRTLDLSSPAIGLTTNRSGTSAYAVLVIDGRKWGALLPKNSATNLHGEVAAFEIGRALGLERLVGAGAHYTLAGPGLERFRDLLAGETYRGAKEENRQRILAEIAKSPSIPTVVKPWQVKPYDYDRGVSGNTLRLTDPIAKFLDDAAPQPSANAMTIPGVPGAAREIDLARSLSNVLVIDVLTGQWDRFSGGNLQVTSENDEIRFVALDNGGTWEGKGALRKYLGLLKRFDRNIAARLAEMNAFVSGQTPAYLGFSKPAELQAALGLADREDYWRAFQGKLQALVTHIDGLGPGKYFDEAGSATRE